ncbi:MAG: hypothetical protein Ct9H300mP13_0030 [Gammaproteobacteria bacterium]|nr:MAG: hypothetical protein Ct9H300mP13_0030 [Gammaproteobacteria bacterium]
MDGGPLKGYDALLSTVQMPGGIPVACVAIGKAGARNAAYLAAQMLALSDPDFGDEADPRKRGPTQHRLKRKIMRCMKD